MKRHILFILLLGAAFSSLEAGRGGYIAGGVLGGMALGAMLNQASQPRATYVEQPVYYETPVYYESAPVEYYYESSPTYYEEYVGDGYNADAEINRHINMHQRDNVLERTEMQRNARSELDAREAELNKRELALKQREAAIPMQNPSAQEEDRESVYEDPFEEFNQK